MRYAVGAGNQSIRVCRCFHLNAIVTIGPAAVGRPSLLIRPLSPALPPVSFALATLPAELALWAAPTLALLLAVGGANCLFRARGTTLVAPAAWWIAAAIAIAAVEAMLALKRFDAATLAASLWRYAAAVGAFCPLIAVLGAKRPQDRGWQWVVAALWLVLLVPVAQAMVAPGGTRLELFAGWRWLLWGFIAMGLLNYLPTRFALSSLLIAAGQYLLLEGAAGNLAEPKASRATLWGVGLLLAAWFVGEIAYAARRSRAAPPSPAAQTPAQRWLAFRDGWGAFWAIRVLQRVNQTAELSRWPIRLQWSGFVAVSDASDGAVNDAGAARPLEPSHDLLGEPAIAQSLDQTLDGMLRRFERLA